MMRGTEVDVSDEDVRLQMNYPQQQPLEYHQQQLPRGYNSPALPGLYGNMTMEGDSIGGGMSNLGSTGPIGVAGSVTGGRYESDNKSIGSKISKFTYSEYPQIKPTNPLYTSTATIRTATSAASRTSTMNTVSRRQKYNPNAPRRLYDWRWVSALAVLLFFPTGLIAIGLAIKARTKFHDGFIDDAKKLNQRAFVFAVVSFCLGTAWILTAFFMMDKWPRTYG